MFLYATPLTTSDASLAVAFSCSENTPVWETLSRFYSEYLLTSDRELIRKLFQVTRLEHAHDRANNDIFRKTKIQFRRMPPHLLRKINPDLFRTYGLESVLDLSAEALRTVDLESMCTKELDTLEMDGSIAQNPLAVYFRWH